MRRKTLFFMTCIIGASSMFSQRVLAENMPDKTSVKDNILVKAWNTPYNTPPFNEIKDSDYVPAIIYAIDVARAEIATIVNDKQTPTFENTIEALDKSGDLVNRVVGLLFNILEADHNNAREEASIKVMPLLTQYENDNSLNQVLFERVKAVYQKKDSLKLTKEQNMLLYDTYKSFSRNGANLSDKDKEKYRAITQELSDLSLKFGSNVLKDKNQFSMLVANKDEVKGLPVLILDQAKERADAKGKKGWLFDLSEPSYIPFMKYVQNRDLRKKMYEANSKVAFVKNEYNNEANVKRIAQLRLELAQILGYPTYADYALEEQMAQNAQKASDFLKELRSYSIEPARKDIKMLQEYAAGNGLKGEMQSWDVSYYMEKLRTEKYNLNDEMLKPYFEVEKVKNGIFGLASRLYGLRFDIDSSVSVYNPDVQVYKVYDGDRLMAVLYLDLFARESKRGGAWMTSFRGQSIDEKGEDIRPFVQLVLNFPPRTADGNCLLSFSDVNTFLHEFGHSLHGMLSECHYIGLSGTGVARDFVELPSQIMENWATEKEFLDMFATHYKTGEAIPGDLIKRLVEADRFMAGYFSIRQLTFGTLDMAWHTISKPVTQTVAEFEKEAQKELILLPVVENANMSVQFGHVFSGGYAAGYYGYKWAEVLDADAFKLFKEKGIFNQETAKSFRVNVLSKGGSEEPMDLYVRFRGREPKVAALLERGGLKQ